MGVVASEFVFLFLLFLLLLLLNSSTVVGDTTCGLANVGSSISLQCSTLGYVLQPTFASFGLPNQLYASNFPSALNQGAQGYGTYSVSSGYLNFNNGGSSQSGDVVISDPTTISWPVAVNITFNAGVNWDLTETGGGQTQGRGWGFEISPNLLSTQSGGFFTTIPYSASDFSSQVGTGIALTLNTRSFLGDGSCTGTLYQPLTLYGYSSGTSAQLAQVKICSTALGSNNFGDSFSVTPLFQIIITNNFKLTVSFQGSAVISNIDVSAYYNPSNSWVYAFGASGGSSAAGAYHMFKNININGMGTCADSNLASSFNIGYNQYCHASNSLAVVNSYCAGLSSCTIPSISASMFGGDPCSTISGTRQLKVLATCVLTSPTVTLVTPSSIYSGIILSINGSNFGGYAKGDTVTVGGYNCSIISGSFTSSFLQCLLPSIPSSVQSGTMSLIVTTNVTNSSPSSPYSLNYISTPVLSSLSPTYPVPRTATITINGLNFDSTASALSITLNSTVIGPFYTCSVISGSLIVGGTQVACTLPSVIPSGNYSIEMTKNSVAAPQSLSVTVSVDPNITSISPSSGQVGTSISINGVGFGTQSSNVQVTFAGSITAIVTYVSNSLIIVSAPFYPVVGQVIVSLTVLSLPCDSNGYFTYTTQTSTNPILLSLTPYGVRNGTIVSVLGASFGSSQSAISLSLLNTITNSSLGNCSIVSGSLTTTGTSLTCIIQFFNYVPDYTIVNVQMVASGLSSNTPYLQLQVSPIPIISSIFPLGGLANSLLTITGSGFYYATTPSSMQVNIGSSSCSIVQQYLNSTFCVCVVPSNSLGSQSVSVSLWYGTIPSPSLPSFSYTYVNTPIVVSVSPLGGLAGSIITIQGYNFGSSASFPALSVALGGNSNSGCVSGSVYFISSSTISCNTSSSLSLGSQLIQVILYQSVISQQSVSFLVIPLPSVTSFSPAGGVAGTILQLQGINFGSLSTALTINLGSVQCPIVSGSLNTDGTRVQCVVPSQTTQSGFFTVPVTMSLYNTVANVSALLPFQMIVTATVYSNSPGGVAGSIITFYGSNFGSIQSAITVTVANSYNCPLVPSSLSEGGTSFSCIAPNINGILGSTSISVSVYSQLATSSLPLIYTYISQPILSSISPLGTTAGSVVTVSGTGFGNVESDLVITIALPPTFNEFSCPIVVGSLNAQGTIVSCTLPLNQTTLSTIENNNIFNVSLSRFGVSPVSALEIEYIIPPMISSINPAGSLTTGGNLITISGSGFGFLPTALTVLVNNVLNCYVDISAIPVSDTQFGCILPAVSAGIATITVTRFNVVGVNNFSFVYFNAPVVTQLSPAGGVTGTIVTVNGINFGTSISALSFGIGNNFSDLIPCPIVPGSLTGTTSFICVVGNILAHNVANSTSTTIGLYSQLFGSQTIFDVVNPPPSISSLSPINGNLGTQIIVTGSGFGQVESALFVNVTVGTTLSGSCIVVTGTLNVAGTSFACRVPVASGFNGIGVATVSVSIYGIYSSSPSSSSIFTFLAAGELLPIVFSTNPLGGMSNGTNLTITGANFVPSSTTVCVGSAPNCYSCPISTITSTQIVCLVSIPSGAIPFGTYAPIVASSGVGVSDASPHKVFLIDVIFPPLVASISPIGGLNGTLITLTGHGFATQESDISITVGQFNCPIVSNSLTNTNSQEQSVICIAPVNFVGSQVVVLSSLSQSATLPFPSFYYPPTPSIVSSYPQGGIAGETIVTVKLSAISGLPTNGNGVEILFTFPGICSSGAFSICENITLAGSEQGGAVIVFQCLLPSLPLNCDSNSTISSLYPFISQLSVSVFGSQSLSSSNKQFIYANEQPIVTSIFPIGQVAGSILTITGSSFGYPDQVNTIQVLLGNSPCDILPSSFDYQGYLQCQLPTDISYSNSITTSLQMTAYGSLNAKFMLPTVNGIASSNDTDYQVPVIQSRAVVNGLTPKIAKDGMEITIAGAYFTTKSKSNVQVTMAPIHGSTNLPSGYNFTCAISLITLSSSTSPGNGLDRIICLLKLQSSSSSSSSRSSKNGNNKNNNHPHLNYHGNLATTVTVYDVVGTQSSSTMIYYTELDYVAYNSGAVIAFAIISSIIGILILVTMVIYIRYRNEAIFRSQSPVLCCVIMIGMIMGLGSMFSYSGKPNEASCEARIWVPAIAFTLTFGAHSVKSWRISQIFNNSELKAVRITDNNLLARVLVLLAFDIVLLIASILVKPLQPELQSTSSNVYMICNGIGTNPVFDVLFVYKILVVLFGIQQAIATRKVVSQYNESRHIAFCIYNFTGIMILVIPIAIVLGSNPLWFFVFISVAITVIVLSFHFSLFLPRVIKFYNHSDSNENDVNGTGNPLYAVGGSISSGHSSASLSRQESSSSGNKKTFSFD